MKKESKKNFLHAAGFCGVLLAVLLLVGEILTPKMLMNTYWPTTTTHLGFYDLKKDTVDVIFVGSSRGATELMPQVMYDEYGIRSYNLGCQQQNLVTSYYWLKEALRYQSPKAVVLEVDFLFPRPGRSMLNSSEGSVRVAFNHMKWSTNKMAAVHDICKLIPSLSEISFYVPFAQYHARWNELTEEDYDLQAMHDTDDMMGFWFETLKSGVQDYEPLIIGSSTEKEETDPIMEEYLDKIVELCEKENIALLLNEGFAADDTIEKYNTVNAYAEEHGIRFFDFNDKVLYEAVDGDFPNDTYNPRHCNFWGAQKISKYLGNVLQQEYGIAGTADEQWEATREGYEKSIQEGNLVYLTDVEAYLQTLHSDRYTVFLAMQGKVTEYLEDNVKLEFERLGFACNWEKLDGVGIVAVLENDVMLAKDSGRTHASVKGSTRNYKVRYMVTSGEDACSIKLNDQEKALRKDGINLVVYDNLKKKVLDSVVLTTGEENPAVYRK